MPPEEVTTITIPTHLSRPRRVIGPFTRNQVLCILLSIGFSAELYFGLRGMATAGSFGNIVRLVVSAFPLGVAVLASLFSLAGKSLLTWIILFLLYLFRQKDAFWCSICKHDRYAVAQNQISQKEEKSA